MPTVARTLGDRPVFEPNAPRVLIVDDSKTMRILIRRALEEGGINVVGEAENAAEADTMIKAYNPDVLSLDVEMPGMSGLDYLDQLMKTRPMPVVMFSNLTQKGAQQSIDAMASGAFDCVAKPTSPGDFANLDGLCATIRAAVASSCVPRGQARNLLQRTIKPRLEDTPVFRRVIAIGAETGGVEALIRLLAEFPTNCPPTLVAQKIVPSFLEALIGKLDQAVRPKVRMARHGDELVKGTVYFAPVDGGQISLKGDMLHIEPVADRTLRIPSIDALFASVAQSMGTRSVGLLMTGMGTDGARGLLEMRHAGALTFGQSEGSCTVYDMPRTAMRLGAVEREVHLRQLTNAILRAATKEESRVGAVDRVSESLRSLA